MKFRITALAKADLKEIAIYTEKNFGKSKRYEYLGLFDEAFGKVAENPNIGRQREEFETELKCYLVERHFIFYRKVNQVVEIIRILNSRLDIHKHLHQ